MIGPGKGRAREGQGRQDSVVMQWEAHKQGKKRARARLGQDRGKSRSRAQPERSEGKYKASTGYGGGRAEKGLSNGKATVK